MGGIAVPICAIFSLRVPVHADGARAEGKTEFSVRTDLSHREMIAWTPVAGITADRRREIHRAAVAPGYCEIHTRVEDSPAVCPPIELLSIRAQRSEMAPAVATGPVLGIAERDSVESIRRDSGRTKA
jgi:hypothetical protein